MFEMGKKRTVRKRINKKKQVKKDVKKEVKKDEKKDVSKMTRLEYESSMMDPRFRAAMMGFNNAPNNAQQYITHALHEKEVKNNELTNLITKEQELKKAKEEEIRLKDELAKTKSDNKDKITELEIKLKTEQLQKEKEIMEKEHQYQTQITEMKAEITRQKQSQEHDQQLFKQEQEIKKMEHEKEMNAITEATEEIKKLREKEELRHQETQSLLNANTDLITENIKSQYSKQTKMYQDIAADLKRKEEILKTQSETLNQFKDAQAKYIQESIKSNMDPMIRQVESQTQNLKNINDTQQMIFNKQQELENKKVQLTEAQVNSIIEPQIRALENQKAALERILKQNGDVNGLYQKIEDLKTQIVMLKQQATPEQIQEHGQEVRSVSLQMAPLQIQKRLAQDTNERNIEFEKLNSEVVELGAKALGEDFNVREIGTPELNEKLKKRSADIQKETAIIAAQKKELERKISMEEGLENDKIEMAKNQAKLDVMKNHSSQYNQAIYETGKERARIEEENQRLTGLTSQLANLKQTHEDLYAGTVTAFQDFLNKDESKFLLRTAQELTGQENPDPRCLPDLINRLQDIHDNNTELLRNLPPLLKFGNLNNTIYTIEQQFAEAGHNIHEERYNMYHELQRAQLERRQALNAKTEAQQRLKQASNFIHGLYDASTIPVREPHKGEDQDYLYHEGDLGAPNTKETTERLFPTGKEGKFVMTAEKWDNLKEKAGIPSMTELFQYTDKIGDSPSTLSDVEMSPPRREKDFDESPTQSPIKDSDFIGK